MRAFLCIIVIMLSAVSNTNSFSVLQRLQHARFSTSLAAAKRRGNLGSLVEETGTPMTKRKNQSKRGKQGGKSTTAQISPDLAKFMESKESSSTAVATPTVSSSDDDDDNDEAVSYTSFSSKRLNQKKASAAPRRVRQTQRQKDAAVKAAAVQTIVDELANAIVNKTVSHPLEAVTTALEALPRGSNSMPQVLKSPTPLDYRLLWVASDATVCAVGSALHKTVALARLQEVFLTLQRNRVQLVEVVRILGPFPNVKNTVLGSSKVMKKDETWRVTWDSMVDGTGKERLEGSETKTFAAAIDYADEQLIVLRLLHDDQEKGASDNEYVVFVREPDMETKLDQLRAL